MESAFRRGAREGLRDFLPISVGLLPWAMVTGIAMRSIGLSPLEAMGMNLLVYAGTAQLGTLPLIVIGAPWWLILATALVVNLRFVIFSAALAGPLAGGTLPQRWLCGYLLTDGVFATCLERLRHEADPEWRLGYYLAPSLWCALVWQSSALTGVLAAGAIPRGWSLEFMASIALLVLLVPMARVRPMLVAMLTGGVLSVLLRGLPLRLGVMAAIVGGIAAGFATEHLQKKPEAR